MKSFKQYMIESKEHEEYHAQLKLSDILDNYDKDQFMSDGSNRDNNPSVPIWNPDKTVKTYYKWNTWDDGIHAIASSLVGHYHIHGLLDDHFGREVKNKENSHRKIFDTFEHGIGKFRHNYVNNLIKLSNNDTNIKTHVDRLLSYSNPSGFKDVESRNAAITSLGRTIFDDKFNKAKEFHTYELLDHISKSDPDSVRTHLINLNKSKTEKFNDKLGLVFHGGTEINNRLFKPTHKVDVIHHGNYSVESPREIFQKKTPAQIKQEEQEANHFIDTKLSTGNLEDGLAAVNHPRFGGWSHMEQALDSPHLEVQKAAVNHKKFGTSGHSIAAALYSPHLEIQKAAVNSMMNNDFYRRSTDNDEIKIALKSKFPEIRTLAQQINIKNK